MFQSCFVGFKRIRPKPARFSSQRFAAAVNVGGKLRFSIRFHFVQGHARWRSASRASVLLCVFADS